MGKVLKDGGYENILIGFMNEQTSKGNEHCFSGWTQMIKSKALNPNLPLITAVQVTPN